MRVNSPLFSSVLMVITVAAGAPKLRAQTASIIPAARSCERCRLVMRTIATIGLHEDSPVYGSPKAIALDRKRQRVLVVSQKGPQSIREFDFGGRVRNEIGLDGEGPGEFQDVAAIWIGAGDSLYVVDNGNARLSVFSARRKLAREAGVPFRLHDVAPLRTHRIVANADVRRPGLAGLPLHLLDPEGARVASFGTGMPAPLPNAPYVNRRSVAADSIGNVWAAHRQEYVLELWNAEGALQQTLRRDAGWFRPYLRQREATTEIPRHPTLQDVGIDEVGRLWVALLIPDPEFASALDPKPSYAEGQRYHKLLGGWQDVEDGLIEVINPKDGRVIVRARLDAIPIAWLGSGSVALYEERDGVPIIKIAELAIRGL